MVTRVFLRRKKRVENGEKREESEVTMGAPKGNTNALKHGLYAKHFTAEEQATLRKMAPDDVFEIHAHVRKMMEEAVRNNQQVDVQALAQITNTLSLAMTALNTTARTYALFAGTEPSFNEDFEEALNSLPVFLDDAYLTETNEDADEGEILTGDEGE
jgi:uncharacterized protein YjcR